MHKWVLLVIAACSAVSSALGQPAQRAYPVELSMPFGMANGKLVIAGEYLIFVNDSNVENSFAISRNSIQEVSLDNGVTTIALRQPMRDQSGERSKLSLRFSNASDADSVSRWSRAATADRAVTVPFNAAEPKIEGQQFTYEVKHSHRVGSCTGRLIVTADRIIYESLTDVNDSREWSMKDIKEVEHKNPYKLDVRPFTGSDYGFVLLGKGMDNADYTMLTKLIARARATR